MYYYGARYYDPRISIFISVDPLAEKTMEPYSYVGNNPIMFTDPTGMEKIIALDENNENDQIIIAGAKKFKDDNGIHIFAHGSSKGFSAIIGGKTYRIRTAKDLQKFLEKNSSTWQNKKVDEKITIILHSCRTGRDAKDGSDSFAKKISESKIFENTTIIAPNERVYINEDGEVGSYKAKYADKFGDYKFSDELGMPKKTDKSDTPGSWLIFEKGDLIDKYRGDWKPKPEPNTWDKFTKKEDL